MSDLRWWGQDWGAAICHPDYKVPVPNDEQCNYCHHPILISDSGISTPDGHTHLDCHLILIGGTPHGGQLPARDDPGQVA